jgi:hypothetical protein
MTQQPFLSIGGKPVTDVEATTALMSLIQEDKLFLAQFTNKVLGLRNDQQEAEIATLQAALSDRGSNGTGDLEKTAVSAGVEGEEQET